VTCENKKLVTVDSMEVDVDDNKVKEATIPVAAEVTPPPVPTKNSASSVAAEVTPPPVPTKNSASSKPAKRRITPIAIN